MNLNIVADSSCSGNFGHWLLPDGHRTSFRLNSETASTWSSLVLSTELRVEVNRKRLNDILEQFQESLYDVLTVRAAVAMSERSLLAVWDNPEDAIYDDL